MKHTRVIPDDERQRLYQQDISAVTVPSEVAYWYDVDVSTVHIWCNEGKVWAVQPENSNHWIISTRSVWDWKGIPDKISSLSEEK